MAQPISYLRISTFNGPTHFISDSFLDFEELFRGIEGLYNGIRMWGFI